MDSKGQVRISILDVLLTVILIVILGVFAVSSTKILDDSTQELKDADLVQGDSEEQLDEVNTYWPTFLDGAFVFIFAIFYVGSVYIAFRFGASQEILVLYLVLIIVLVFASGHVSNMWNDVTEVGFLSTDVDKLPMTDWILSNFPVMMMLLGMSDLIAMYFRRSGTAL